MKRKILTTIWLLGFFVISITSSGQISNNYPKDSLIENDPNVLYVEMFEQDTLSTMLSRYSNVSNPANISFDTSIPAGSWGHQSCKLRIYQTPASQNATEMVRKFTPGINDSVFVRYYVKYNNTHRHRHSGVWLGGTNPAYVCFPCHTANTVPAGDSSFQVGSEVRGATMAAQSNAKFGFFNYWMAQHTNFANQFQTNTTNDVIDMTSWNCIEVMLKLNYPLTDSTGEVALWVNGVPISHYGYHFPTGTWNSSIFVEGAGMPFDGFRWRNNVALKFNYIWIKNYANQNTNLSANDILYDNIVVAKSYIGPIYDPPEPGKLYYRSRQTGNWNEASTWETSPFTDFSTGVVSPAASFPDETNSYSVTIRKGNIVTITANGKSREIQVESDLIVNVGVDFSIVPN